MNKREFLKDIMTLRLGKLREKYPPSFFNGTIGELIQVAQDLTPNLLIDNSWKGDFTDRRPFYLSSTDTGYEVFGNSERGGKDWAVFYNDWNSAAFDFLDRFLNELGHAAPDSIINKKSY